MFPLRPDVYVQQFTYQKYLLELLHNYIPVSFKDVS